VVTTAPERVFFHLRIIDDVLVDQPCTPLATERRPLIGQKAASPIGAFRSDFDAESKRDKMHYIAYTLHGDGI